MSTPSPQQAPRPRAGGSVSGVAWVALLVLLVLPGYALSRFTGQVDWRVLVGVPLALSVFTWVACRSDKRRAEAGGWRISEAVLHLAELLGGWPGGFLAQRRFRHKNAKGSYQFVFWSIVLLHQLIAIDSLSGWRYLREMAGFVGVRMG